MTSIMRKTVSAVAMAAVVFAFAQTARAEKTGKATQEVAAKESVEEAGGKPQMHACPKAMAAKQGKKECGGCCPKCPCPMHTTMMKAMSTVSMVATEDGGVVVLAGGKLTKYDKNLAVKAEAEVKTDVAGMHTTMKHMCEKCPMNKGGGCKMGKPEAEPAAEKE